ncbi:response regulator [Luteolibacter soli]|uniref:Response regulator n=1 Tax=Luteolibacter soli TaxID=3135280 RepID=A0ABU9ANB5_9BACT
MPNDPAMCVVDDDPAVLKSLGRLLGSEGYVVRTFGNPAEFIRHACDHPVPLVVVDFMMSGLSGLQVQERLRALSPETRLIMISATTDPEIDARFLAGGAVAIFHKPFDEDEFLDAVRRVLDHAA